MKTLHIRRQLDLPSNVELEDFENNAGIELPTGFKKFILLYNAIDFQESIIDVQGNRYFIDVFYPFTRTREPSLQLAYTALREYLQNEYIAFADDGGGWQFVFSLKREDFGSVYFCRTDKAPPVSLTFLAKTFEEFVEKLQIE